jgi:hypothetical protein
VSWASPPPAERIDHGGIHESAGVVLASSDPSGVTGVIRLSRASYRKMLQHLDWAARYNVIAIPLAAGVLAWAGLALSARHRRHCHEPATIVVALNAQTLRPGRCHPRTCARVRGDEAADISRLAVWVAAGLVGARAYHMITDVDRFSGRWWHASPSGRAASASPVDCSPA